MADEVKCTMHEGIESHPSGRSRVYPYRCPRCGECLLCGHKLVYPREAGNYWICKDGGTVPARMLPGVSVD